jgi:hypothetical protein
MRVLRINSILGGVLGIRVSLAIRRGAAILESNDAITTPSTIGKPPHVLVSAPLHIYLPGFTAKLKDTTTRLGNVEMALATRIPCDVVPSSRHQGRKYPPKIPASARALNCRLPHWNYLS